MRKQWEQFSHNFPEWSLNLINNVGSSCRYDWLAKKNIQTGYFLWAMFAYGLGKVAIIESTFFRLIIYQVYDSLTKDRRLAAGNDIIFPVVLSLDPLFSWILFFCNASFNAFWTGRSSHHICGTELDGWAWPTGTPIHRAIHTG